MAMGIRAGLEDMGSGDGRCGTAGVDPIAAVHGGSGAILKLPNSRSTWALIASLDVHSFP